MPDTLRARALCRVAAAAPVLVLLAGAAGCSGSGTESSASTEPVAVTTMVDSPSGSHRGAGSGTTPGSSLTVGTIASEPTYEVEVTTDVVYATGETTAGPIDLTLDTYAPVGAEGPLPAMIFLHGGGFRSGTTSQEAPVQIAQALASRGVVVLNVDDRPQGDDPVLSARVAPWLDPATADPASLATAVVAPADDLLRALDWLEAGAAELDVDPERVALGGGSAGAVTALDIAYAADEVGIEHPPVDAVVSFWGSLRLADPAVAIGTGDPAVLLIHGTADETVPFDRSQAVATAAAATGVAAVLIPLEGEGHGFEGKDLAAVRPETGRSLIDDVVAFLQGNLT